jgi:uncharacterized membrane protein
MPQKTMTDQRIENVLGNLLRIGVGLSATIVFCGAIIYLARHGHAPASYRVFEGEPSDLHSLHGIAREAIALNGRGIIPAGRCSGRHSVARVMFSIWVAAKHDLCTWRCVIVLCILLQPGGITKNHCLRGLCEFAPFAVKELTLRDQSKP